MRAEDDSLVTAKRKLVGNRDVNDCCGKDPMDLHLRSAMHVKACNVYAYAYKIKATLTHATDNLCFKRCFRLLHCNDQQKLVKLLAPSARA